MQQAKKKEAAQEGVLQHDTPPLTGMDKLTKLYQALLW